MEKIFSVLSQLFRNSRSWQPPICAACAICFTLSFITSTGCQSRLTEDEYVRWVTDYDNHLHVKESVFDFIFDIQYQPEELMRIQRASNTSSGSELSSERVSVESLQYYTLRVSTENGVDVAHFNVGDLVQKQERQYYFSYRFQNDITLEENGKILPCLLYHAEGRTGGNGVRTFLLGFERPTVPSQDVRIVIRSELFGSLPIKIKVAKARISMFPL